MKDIFKRFTLSILIIFCALNLALIVTAQNIVVTTRDNASLRSMPSTSGERIAVVPFDTTMDALGRTEEATWTLVEYAGQRGFISNSLLNWSGPLETLPVIGEVTIAPSSSASANEETLPSANFALGSVVGTVRGTTLNVRSGPSTSDSVLGQLQSGATIGLTSRYGTNWVSFNYENGTEGWVAAWLLIFEGEITDLPDREAELLAAQNARLALRQQLPQVCNGVPAPSTAPYTGNTVVIAYNTVSLRVHPQNNALGEFTSSELENINLVACIEAEEISQIQECFYNGPSIFRFARTANVTLRIAQTGEVLVSGVLFGPAPRECRQSEPYNLTRLTGGAMEGTELVRWLPIFVHP